MNLLYKTFFKAFMTKKITFSAFGRDSYYHREWFKKNGFKLIQHTYELALN